MAKDKCANCEWGLIFIGLVLYSCLVFLDCFTENKVWRYFNLNDTTPYLFGYFFATVLGHWPINKIRNKAWEPIVEVNKAENDKKEKFIYRPYYACVIGWIERPLYIASFQLQFPQFVAIWIGAKIAGGWEGWKKPLQGRDIFNAFMIGNAMSLVYATWGYLIIQWFYSDPYKIPLIIITALLVLASWLIWFFLKKQAEKMGQQSTS